MKSYTIKDSNVYKLKGYTIESIIELAYRFGKHDERFQTVNDQTKNSLTIVKKNLLEYDSFKELNHN